MGYWKKDNSQDHVKRLHSSVAKGKSVFKALIRNVLCHFQQIHTSMSLAHTRDIKIYVANEYVTSLSNFKKQIGLHGVIL